MREKKYEMAEEAIAFDGPVSEHDGTASADGRSFYFRAPKPCGNEECR